MMYLVKNCFFVLVTALLLTFCLFSPDVTSRVSFIALLAASLTLMYISQPQPSTPSTATSD
jgi:hypothetical protein